MSVVYKLGVLKHFASWGIESYLELYQVFMLNLFKYFDQKTRQFSSKNVSMPSNQNMTRVTKYVPRGQNVSIPAICILLICDKRAHHLKGDCWFWDKITCNGLKSILIGNSHLGWSYCLSVTLERCNSWFDEFPSYHTFVCGCC